MKMESPKEFELRYAKYAYENATWIVSQRPRDVSAQKILSSQKERLAQAERAVVCRILGE